MRAQGDHSHHDSPLNGTQPTIERKSWAWRQSGFNSSPAQNTSVETPEKRFSDAYQRKHTAVNDTINHIEKFAISH